MIGALHPAPGTSPLLRTALPATARRRMSAGRGASPLALAIALLLPAPPLQALELGPLTLQSRLGQPLAATVMLRLAPGEVLGAGCLISTAPPGDLPKVPGLRVIAGDATGPATALVRLSSGSPLAEPAYGLRLGTGCAGMPVLARDYVVMPDLPGSQLPEAPLEVASASGAPPPEAVTAPGEPPARAAATAPPAAPADESAPTGAGDAVPTGLPSGLPAGLPARSLPTARLAPGDRYTVLPGETLWSIASRVQGLAAGTRATAAALHAANPRAFIAGDAGRLRAGAELLIGAPPARQAPSAVPADPPTSAVARVARPAPAPPVPGNSGMPAPASATAGVPAMAADGSTAPAAGGAAPPAPAEPAETAATADPVAPAPLRLRSAAAPASDDPLTQALAGGVSGLLLSLALWWHARRRAGRKPAAIPATVPASKGPLPAVAVTTTAAAATAAPARSREPAISVSFEPLPAAGRMPSGTYRGIGRHQGAPAATDDTTGSSRLRAPDEITAELEELFNTPTAAWATDASTVQARRLAGSGAIDLPALAVGSDTDAHKAQGLRDALALLERDYEQENTDTRRTIGAADATPTPPRLRGLG